MCASHGVSEKVAQFKTQSPVRAIFCKICARTANAKIN